MEALDKYYGSIIDQATGFRSMLADSTYPDGLKRLILGLGRHIKGSELELHISIAQKQLANIIFDADSRAFSNDAATLPYDTLMLVGGVLVKIAQMQRLIDGGGKIMGRIGASMGLGGAISNRIGSGEPQELLTVLMVVA